jgi:hypothetical protein
MVCGDTNQFYTTMVVCEDTTGVKLIQILRASG